MDLLTEPKPQRRGVCSFLPNHLYLLGVSLEAEAAALTLRFSSTATTTG
ncbi:hypothetical protein ACPOL_1017 [Acidisarcina polymorpha]|uniref:Uncharacterized protein n=1 Tax=Acidisarcina polymorpha TaxID=2211140 RepID=A0A2Z5FU49_9BACT|nr:hypothetical protein ACPOL_1017 [Acidisarcina polymorpha]